MNEKLETMVDVAEYWRVEYQKAKRNIDNVVKFLTELTKRRDLSDDLKDSIWMAIEDLEA